MADRGGQARQSSAGQAEGAEGDDGAQREPEPEPRIADGEDRQGDQGQRQACDDRAVAPAHARIDRRHHGAEQDARRHGGRGQKRPGGEDQRGQKPERGGHQKRAGMEADLDLGRHERRQQRRGREGKERAEHEARADPDGGQRQHLDQIDAQHEAVRCAQALECGDAGDPAVEIALDRIGNADPADQKRGQTDERQIDAEALDRLAHARRGLGWIADTPARVGEIAFETRQPARGIDVLPEPDAIGRFIDAARLQQLGRCQRLGRDQNARSKRHQRAAAVGLLLDRRADLEGGFADADAVADGDAKTCQHVGLDRSAVFAAALGQHIGKRVGWFEADGAVERIGPVHGLQFHQQHALARMRHGAHFARLADGARGVKRILLGGGGRAVAQRDLQIAAQDRARIGGQAGLDRARQRFHARDGADAQRQRQQDHGQAADAAAQLAPRQTERQSHAMLPSSRPSAMRTTRSHWRTISRSWLIRTSVVP